MILARLLAGLAGLLYPEFPKCPSCGQGFQPEEIDLCTSCISQIEFIKEEFCPQCGKLTRPEEELCLDCQEQKRLFSKARAVGVYDAGLEEYIKEFKYDKCRELARPLGGLLAIYTRRFYQPSEVDLITYIPVHQERLKERGFNQAYLLARELGQNLDLAVNSLLVRQQDTVKQSKLSRQERLQNVKGKFSIAQPYLVTDKQILLVDDILTTGATVNEASRILLKAEADKVQVMTLATGRSNKIRRNQA
ncbi:ComF family protein [Halanaerobaculum tunisiense]